MRRKELLQIISQLRRLCTYFRDDVPAFDTRDLEKLLSVCSALEVSTRACLFAAVLSQPSGRGIGFVSSSELVETKK